ncbi:MAG: sigma-70 family RNA polymerase sigma factor [Myxococcales bacterium]
MTEHFPQLFRTHAPFVWRVLRRYGVREQDLEDACQEVFLVVHRRQGDFEGRSSLRTWLYGIARKVASGSRRTMRPTASAEALEFESNLPVSESDPEADLDRNRTLLWLNTALGEIDEDQREVFVLYELEYLTMAEVAEAVGCNETTALYRLEAARDKLRRALKRRALARTYSAPTNLREGVR